MHLELFLLFPLKLQFLEAKNNIVVIAGPTKGVGKSFLSANLTHLLANDKKILLIDGDLRKGHLKHYFSVSPQYGLTDYLQSNIELKNVIASTRFDNIDFISNGPSVAHSSDLLATSKFPDMLKLMSEQYDYVIIDTSPVLLITDALLIMQHAGFNLLVFDCSRHDVRELELTKKKIEQGEIKINGFVFNGITEQSHYYRGKYHYKY